MLLVVNITSAAIAEPVNAEEPHSSEAHDYDESIYKSGSVLDLSSAIKRAIDSSPRFKSANARLDAAKGAEDQAGAWENPEVGFEAENVSGSGQFSGTDSAEYTYGVSQKIEVSGKRSARIDAAQAVREAANAELFMERLNLERDVHVAYSEVLAEAEAVKLALEQEKLAKDVLATVTRRVNAAAEPEIQKSKAQVAYSTSVIKREQEEKQLRIAKAKLAKLWGDSKLNNSLDHSHFFDLEAPAAIESYKSKFANIPDIERLAYLQAEKESLYELEKAEAIPDPSLNLGVRDFRDSGEQAFVVGVSLPIPVWNQNDGGIAKAQGELRQIESDVRMVELRLEQELLENVQNWQSSYSEAKRLRTELLPLAEKAFKLARSGYEKGRFAYLEVLDAQRTLFDARSQYHDALKRYHTARANVERLTTEIGDKNEIN